MPREMVKRVNISFALSSPLLMLSYVSLLSFLLDNLCERCFQNTGTQYEFQQEIAGLLKMLLNYISEEQTPHSVCPLYIDRSHFLISQSGSAALANG